MPGKDISKKTAGKSGAASPKMETAEQYDWTFECFNTGAPGNRYPMSGGQVATTEYKPIGSKYQDIYESLQTPNDYIEDDESDEAPSVSVTMPIQIAHQEVKNAEAIKAEPVLNVVTKPQPRILTRVVQAEPSTSRSRRKATWTRADTVYPALVADTNRPVEVSLQKQKAPEVAAASKLPEQENCDQDGPSTSRSRRKATWTKAATGNPEPATGINPPIGLKRSGNATTVASRSMSDKQTASTNKQENSDPADRKSTSQTRKSSAGEKEGPRRAYNNRDLMLLAADDSCCMYRTPFEPKPPNPPPSLVQNLPYTDSGEGTESESDEEVSDDGIIDFSNEFGVIDLFDSEGDAEVDARLQNELDSLTNNPNPSRAVKVTPSTPSTPYIPTDDDIDARLQAELDSLPVIEAEGPSQSRKLPVDSSRRQDLYNDGPSTSTGIVRAPALPFANPTKAQPKPFGTNMLKMAKIPPATMSRAPIHQRGGMMPQMPIVTRLKSIHGEDISVSVTTGPDGLVTNVAMLQAPQMDGKRKGIEAESFTASQLDVIMRSAQPYLALPMTPKGSDLSGEMVTRQYDFESGVPLVPEQAVEDEEVDYEEIGVADTFAEYWPSKLNFGRAHPDPVVETSTLSSVELPDITYKLSLPQETMNFLSALQLEALVYACQAHEQILPSGERAGFLLGDGAGVGKGRTIAGIIYDNYLKGRRRSLWISVSNDLKFDAERDLYDIGALDRIPLATMSKFKYSRIDSEENDNFNRGIVFCTYTALIGESQTASAKYKTRLRQLVNWLGKRFDGVIVFDECHKAKNLSVMNVGKSTKTGNTVLELQKLLPHARVVYASATGASEPRNMAYMVRLGLWGPGTAYPEFYEFVGAVEKRGIGAMEIVAMDMKLRGTYIARQLSFKEVAFHIEEVAINKDIHKVFNQSAELWAEIYKKFQKACRLMCVENKILKIITCQFWCAHQRFFKNLCIVSKVDPVVKMTRLATRMGKAVVIGLQSTGESRTLEHLHRSNGKLTSFVSTARMIVQSFVEKHFPAPKRDAFHHLLNTGEFQPDACCQPQPHKKAKMHSDWVDDDMDAEADDSDVEFFDSGWDDKEVKDEKSKAGRKRRGRPPKADKVDKITMQERILLHLRTNMRAQDNEGSSIVDSSKPQKANITERDVERCISSREALLEKIESAGRRMPPNTLDKLIADLGGTNLVAEMTGRRGRVVRTELGGFKYELRCESDSSMDLVNYREKQRFMDGSKHVAIISEAASSGISLQSDKRVANQRRRTHITLELPWSADRAIQQFGRTHRSNQVNSPEYIFVITDLAGERRFASTVAKRLESLGALTQGDRRATDARDLSQFNIDNHIGRCALENVMQQLTGERPLEVDLIPEYKGNFVHDCGMAMVGVGMLNLREEGKKQIFSVGKESNNISKFLNRILGCRVEMQNALFKFFLDKMYSLILQKKRAGDFDLGIVDLDAHGASVKSTKLLRFVRKHATGIAATELHTVQVERGMHFDAALAKFNKESRHDHDGFYVLQQLRHKKNAAILCIETTTKSRDKPDTAVPSKISLQIYRPNTGPQVRQESLSSILMRYVKVPADVARVYWTTQYEVCLTKCSHFYWTGLCPYSGICEVGLRLRTYHVLSGLMLPIWDRIELIIEREGQKIQIIRVKTDVNKKIVGTVVPHSVYDALVENLSTDSVMEQP